MNKRVFGTDQNGATVTAYTIADGNLSACILDRGATIQSLIFDGVDVCLGYETVADYEAMDGYLGATIGRYGNRIAGGKFTVNGKEYTVDCNEGGVSHLHGGNVGYDKLIWTCVEHTDTTLTLSLTDRGEDSGYPGTLEVTVRFTVEQDALIIDYSAVGDEDTPFNPTNHCYFNLGGADAGLSFADCSMEFCHRRHRCKTSLDQLSEMVFFCHLYCHGMALCICLQPDSKQPSAFCFLLAPGRRHDLYHRRNHLCTQTSDF